MQITSFRITNFRSIVDTGWVNLSKDNLTALVGQNESGKTAVLSALAATFSTELLHMDDVRQDDTSMPVIWLETKFTPKELQEASGHVSSSHAKAALLAATSAVGGTVKWRFAWEFEPGKSALRPSCDVESPDFNAIVAETAELLAKTTVQSRSNGDGTEQTVLNSVTAVGAPAAATPVAKPPGSSLPATAPPGATPIAPNANSSDEVELSLSRAIDEFRDALFDTAPAVTLFSEESGLLPNRIDIGDDYRLAKSPGAAAVRNFLALAEIDLKALVLNVDNRWRVGALNKANTRISSEFLKFWSQTIGNSSQIQIKCTFNYHPADIAEKAGKPYLEFLIEDGGAPLYPQQRSRGTRWFISFFLQMKASELKASDHFFLLDEPGANLHEKAQVDVLRLLEKIKDSVGVVYSTHSPYLLDEKALYRVIAVERDPKAAGFPTKIIGAHTLGAASVDTLSPIYTLMGANLSHQTAIKKKNNVILEELSAQYYLRAFWKLLACEQEVNFLSATGVSNVEMLANLFLGWGLEFIILVDDESSGRAAYNKLKRDMFLDDDKWAKSRMYKIDGHGIEDIFSAVDYKKFVLKDVDIDLRDRKNSHWAKANGSAKAMQALQFMLDVDAGLLKLADLDEQTQSSIKVLIDETSLRLKDYDKH